MAVEQARREARRRARRPGRGRRREPVPELTVVIRSAEIDFDRPIVRYLKTYAAETLNGDDVFQENFALTDLPLGTYIVSVKTTRLYRQTITIESGQLAWVTFTVEPPLLSATRTP